MAYTRVNWVNEPSTATPINATNLNKMDAAISNLDAAVETKADNMDGSPSWDFSSNTNGFVVTLRKTGSSGNQSLGLAVVPSGQTAATISNLVNSDGSRNFALYSEFTAINSALNGRNFVDISGIGESTFLAVLGPIVNSGARIATGYYYNVPTDSFPGDIAGNHYVVLFNEPGARLYGKVIVCYPLGIVEGRIVTSGGALSVIKWEEGSTQPRLYGTLSDSDIYDTSKITNLNGVVYKTGNVVEVNFTFTTTGTTTGIVRLNSSGIPSCHATSTDALRPRCVCRARSYAPDAPTMVAEVTGVNIIILMNGQPGTYCGTIVYESIST